MQLLALFCWKKKTACILRKSIVLVALVSSADEWFVATVKTYRLQDILSEQMDMFCFYKAIPRMLGVLNDPMSVFSFVIYDQKFQQPTARDTFRTANDVAMYAISREIRPDRKCILLKGTFGNLFFLHSLIKMLI